MCEGESVAKHMQTQQSVCERAAVCEYMTKGGRKRGAKGHLRVSQRTEQLGSLPHATVGARGGSESRAGEGEEGSEKGTKSWRVAQVCRK